ncbi:hypothetical protein H0H93_009403 [Arthromyces matolae]|nr:hypothetical protein H0H93_009403 [Arthromyces matolae]
MSPVLPNDSGWEPTPSGFQQALQPSQNQSINGYLPTGSSNQALAPQSNHILQPLQHNVNGYLSGTASANTLTPGYGNPQVAQTPSAAHPGSFTLPPNHGPGSGVYPFVSGFTNQEPYSNGIFGPIRSTNSTYNTNNHLNPGWSSPNVEATPAMVTISAAQLEEWKKNIEEVKNTQRQQQEQLDQQRNRENKKKSTKKKMNQALTSLVHQVMNEMVGVESIRDESGTLSKIIPGPLVAGAPIRYKDIGANEHMRLWNPDWNTAPKSGSNRAFLEAVIRHIRQKEKDHPSVGMPVEELTDELMWDSVTQYFKTMRNNWKRQNDERVAAKQSAHDKDVKLRARKKAKADTMRQNIQGFEDLYGKTKTVGLREIIHTDYMSSEHSDCGNVSNDVYTAHRASKIGGGMTNGFEIRRPEWRSKQMNRVYVRLHKMARDGGPRPGETSRRNTVRLPRYHGLPANNNKKNPPKVKGYLAPRSCISDEWIKNNEKKDDDHLWRNDPEDWVILSLDIPLTDFDAHDLAYLADMEDNEGVNKEVDVAKE